MKRLIHKTVHNLPFKLLTFLFALWLSGPVAAQNIVISGKVTDEQNSPLPGVTVTVKGSVVGTTTNEQGIFTLTGVEKDAVLVVSSIGYETKQVSLKTAKQLTISLTKKTNELDETIIRAYGTTTRRLNTGDISKVTAEEIEKQPVSNPLAALEGRVPGLVVTQSSGVPGSSFKVQIRGQNSLLQGSDPLFIIDGVPFAAGNIPINNIANATGSGGSSGISPFSTINPDDIASIEVLKDADATAIYGSRGANGVILITTKKAKKGQTKFNINLSSGIGVVTRTMDMLNTSQYVQMRNEAFKNDGLIPTNSNAPDILVWDTTRYTNLKKLLIGGIAHTTDVYASLSGGNTNTQFLLSTSYHRDGTVFPGNLSANRTTIHSSLNHNSANNKFVLNFTTSYSYDNSNLTGGDLSYYINLPPNILLHNAEGKLNWQEGGVAFSSLTPNPLASLYATYNGRFQNLLSNLQLKYNILPGLSVKTNFGYNFLVGNESSSNPSTSLNPHSGILPYSNFDNSFKKSWIIEPQIEYKKNIYNGILDILVGGSFQSLKSDAISVSARNYTSDLLLGSIAAAGDVTTNNSFNQYNYDAIFALLNYNWNNKYIVNLSSRRDGSSRFGPGKQFSNFGAIGVAWIFSNEPFIQKMFSFISFGKLRFSYGVTGNDQIGNYQYLDSWVSTNNPYQGIPGLHTTKLFNPEYGWEINQKLEGAIELGFLRDRILFTLSYFRNRSGNQLISYPLPIQTGFTFVIKNFDALVQNKGFELSLLTKNISSHSFSWTSDINLTIPNNKLISFPGLSTSTYANTYVLGKSLSVKKTYQYQGVNPNTGNYQFNDVNHDETLNSDDRIMLINTDPDFYGGFQNNFIYKEFQLSVFFEFKKQIGKNYLYTQSNYIPGYYYFNQPVIVLNRWQNPGDKTNIQRFVATGASPAFLPGAVYLPGSDAVYSDASYIRLKSVYLSYSLPSKWMKKLSFITGQIYLQAQNLFTITDYIGADPENQSIYVLPPLRVMTTGIKLTF